MDFHYTVTTDKSINEAIQSLEQKLKENKFGILWQLDLPAKLQEKGVTSYTSPYHILEVCNPKEAARVLNQNELVGYFLPCKITVYQSKDGQTKIGLPKPSAMINLLDDQELQSIAQEIEATLINVLEQSK
ncbi:DUF302 domain-containing protein [Ammoniphilus resinae]|uniref:Uncharacterized protein (DUF302 family) n=1 Tax=Ammoniphilus resinae TaxID=861532 RepID=A0ABS4GL55_9BACL|nr:DUF302 domain-containing protein [Ammoniphilus resinae]MBP1930867.1 uncharacterized protein (DUF302 family) [Ammoniphilus resinae]